MLRSFARRILKIPVLRYVDDCFGADRLECVDVALGALARLVRACLGPTAIAKHKLEVGNGLFSAAAELRPGSSPGGPHTPTAT